MDKFFTLSAGVTLGVMLKEMYMYYYIKQIDHKIKTSINVDLSYEKLVKELDNKPILIASSISNIVNTESKSDNNTLFLKSNLLTKETEDKLLKFKLNENNTIILETNSEDQLKLDLLRNRSYKIIDASILKVSEEFKKSNLNLLQRINLVSNRSNYKNLVQVENGLIKNQRILIYGKLNLIGTNKYIIYPELLIGSGLVEFEEYVEFNKNKINFRLFNLLLFLTSLTLVHFTFKTFFKSENKNGKGIK